MSSLRHALVITLYLTVACSAEDAPAQLAPDGPICGPCDMTMPADYPLTEIAGMKFATCGARCVELITAKPERYAEFAVSE